MNKSKIYIIKNILNIMPFIYIIISIIYLFFPFSIEHLFSFILSSIYYIVLEPLHELGHYCVAKHYIKKKNINVQLCLSRKKTSCSDWNIFSIKEYIRILLFGTIFKVIFCTIGLIISLAYENYLIVNTFSFMIFMEVTWNYQPLFGPSDMKSVFCALENNKIPDTEDTNMSTIRIDFFIRKIYPWILIPVSIIICKLAIPTLYFIKPLFYSLLLMK